MIPAASASTCFSVPLSASPVLEDESSELSLSSFFASFSFFLLELGEGFVFESRIRTLALLLLSVTEVLSFGVGAALGGFGVAILLPFCFFFPWFLVDV